MKISELLRYQQAVASVMSSQSLTNARQILDSVVMACGAQHYTPEPHPRITEAQTAIRQCQQRVDQGLEQLRVTLQNLRDVCDVLINSLHQDYMNRSGKLYSRQYNNMTASDVVAKRLPLTAEQLGILTQRITQHCQWTDNCLLMRPASHDWVPHMASANMLYVWDHDTTMITEALTAYPDRQNGRIRTYTGSDRTPFTSLPKSQMALILALGFFEFKPLDIMLHYLSDFAWLLRPGGQVLFSFNDCDTAVGAEFAEQNYMCYTPGHMVLERLKELGLTVQEQYHGANGVTWIQAQKPGSHRNVMGAPVLTKIHVRSK